MSVAISERCKITKLYRISNVVTCEEVKSLIALKKAVTSTWFSCPDEPNPVKFRMKIKFGEEKKDWVSWYLECDKKVFITEGPVTFMDADLKPLFPRIV